MSEMTEISTLGEYSTINDIKEFLKSINAAYTFGKKEDFLQKYKTYQIWDMEQKFKELIPDEIKFDEYLGYQKNPELRYALDFSDSLVILFCKMVVISQKFKIL